MSRNPVATYLKYANVQMAESLFGLTNSTAQPEEKRYYDRLNSVSLTKGNDRASKFPSALANQFVQNWEVVEHMANTNRI